MRLRKPQNFSFVDEHVAGSAILESPEEVDWIASKGVRVVISLVGPEEYDDAVRRRMEELGIELHFFPVEVMQAPPLEELARIVELIHERIGEGKRVLVHCIAGCGRTGTVLAAYLVSKGMGPDEALDHLRSIRPCSVETMEQYGAIWYYYRFGDELRLRGRTRSLSPRRGP